MKANVIELLHSYEAGTRAHPSVPLSLLVQLIHLMHIHPLVLNEDGFVDTDAKFQAIVLGIKAALTAQ